jgi:alpha-galactosidase
MRRCLPGAEQGWFGRVAMPVAGDRPFRPRCTGVTQSGAELAIDLVDDLLGLTVRQEFAVLPGGAFRLRTRLANHSSTPITLTDPCSAMVPLSGRWQRIVSWRGRHNAELVEQAEPMPSHGWLRETGRGISGHGGPPGLYLLADGATDDAGLVLALQLAWSGDSRLAVERDDEGFWLLSAAAMGEWALAAGETLDLPDAILAISTHGRNGAMAMQHAAVRGLMQWLNGTMTPRPAHVNSWEACYFDHDEARIMELARAAAAIGAERFVLDDGWFRGRNRDTAGLGDWTADPLKYPAGLGPLAEGVTALGLQFGLWVEPEMVNPDSDLYRAHPDWTLSEAGGAPLTARNQLVLDMRRQDVRDTLFEALDRLLGEHPIAYLKWDQNRDHAPSGGPEQVLGTYALLERLRAAHPQVEIEGCAGGGGRSDAGMTRYVHRFWTSDNVDALSRIAMQRAFLAFLPPETMGAHIGASPCHATGRTQSLPFRAAIACMGHLGVEMDPATLADADRQELARWIGFYHQWRDVLHGGEVLIGSGADGLLWQAHGRGEDYLLFVIRQSPAQDRRPQPLMLPFTARQARWDVRLLDIAENHGPHRPAQPALTQQLFMEAVSFTGSWLAVAGLPLAVQQGESVAIYHMKGAVA